MRLTRRAVRDYNFRGTGVEDTLDMWANVRRGEKLYISPFKNKADIIFDSSLPYEVSVMKHYALPLLEAVPEENVPSGGIIGVDRCVSGFSSPSIRNWWIRALCSGSLSAAVLTTTHEELEFTN